MQASASNDPAAPPTQGDRRRCLGRGGMVAVLLVVAAVFDAKAVAAGWLIGFAFWAQILVGSLTLLMIHRLTGGRWGELAAPVIAPAAAAMPLLIVLAIPLFIAIPALYPWSHHPAAIKPDVLSYYLNTPAFIVRTVLALAGWTALAHLAAAQCRSAWPAARRTWSRLPRRRHQQRIDRLVFVARSAVHVIVLRRQRRHLLAGRRARLDGGLGAGAGRTIPPSAILALCCSRPCSASPTSISWPCW